MAIFMILFIGIVFTALSLTYRVNLEPVDKSSEELHIKEDANYLHTQTTASDVWVIVHNLNKFPSVTVIDSAGNEVVGEVIYNDANQVTLKFEGGFKGTATLN